MADLVITEPVVLSYKPPPHRTVTRGEVAARRAAPHPAGGHPKVWQPWERQVAAAQARLRTELQEALHDLEVAEAAAGVILDTAEAMAAEVSGQIRAAAWARWHRDMDAAADAALAVLSPAREAYDRAIGEAHQAYDRMLGDAERVFRSRMADADRAKADGRLASPPA